VFPDATPQSHTSPAMELADGTVRILREYTGRGANRARAVFSDDLAVVVLYDSLTKGEQTLVDHGHADDVLGIRRTFQITMETELRALVERVTGRHVLAFMSANHVDPDVSVESFILGGPIAG
jgi:uncharacterized protein YbcI